MARQTLRQGLNHALVFLMLRLFAAIPIPPAFHRELTKLQRGLPGAKWRPAENFHITLRFAGEIDDHLADDLDAELRAVQSESFTLHLEGANWFGKSDPRAVWIGVGASEPLTQLQARCEKAARRAGLEAETRNFKPHMTLAYLNKTPVDRLAAWCRDRTRFKTEPFQVTHFSLYRSWSQKRGDNIYEAIADYPLV